MPSLSVLLSRLLLAALILLSGAANAATLSATPSTAAPGATFVMYLDGLTRNSSYEVYLERGQPYTSRTKLADFIAIEEEGSRKASVPDTAVLGTHYLVLYSTGITVVERARATFTVGTPLGISFSPTSAEPGRAVQVTVTNVRTGTLQLSYAGESILGPVSVRDGTWVGKFVVPRDRPASLPASVKVTATNAIGRLSSARGAATFSALAPTATPIFRSTYTLRPPSTTEEGSRIAFSGRLQQYDGKGTEGKTSFFWKGDNGQVIPIDGRVTTDADGNYQASARAPSFMMDGARPGSGKIVSVVQDRDPDTGTDRTYSMVTDQTFTATGNFVPGTGQFVVRVIGNGLLGPQPLQGVYVAAHQDLQGAFTDPNDGVPPFGAPDFIGYQSQFTQLQNNAGFPNAVNTTGCPLNFGAQRTNANGEVLFEIDPQKLKHLTMHNALVEMGEIRTVNAGAPVPGVDVFQEDIANGQFGKGGKGSSGETASIWVLIYAGPKGYGETGMRDVDGSPDFPPYDMQPGIVPTLVQVSIDLDTGVATLDGGIGQFGATGGTVSPGVFEARLPRITNTADVVPYKLRIAGLPMPTGTLTKRFSGMHSFPSATQWPDAYFSQRNVGREMRFTWDVGFGAANDPQLWLKLPGDSAMTHYGNFTVESASTCNVEGEFDYKIGLPDLTRLPIPADNGTGSSIAPCVHGKIVVDRSPVDAVQTFKICTRRPPKGMDALNSQLKLSTFRIDAKATKYVGELALPASSVTGDDPQMREYELPPQENESLNDGPFIKTVDAQGQVVDDFDVTTEHIVGNNGTEATDVPNPTLFGFKGNTAARSEIDRVTVLDTGRIPLFRYPWGFSPIAGAVLGADFWMGADVGFYGTLGNPTGNGTLMDATIDPALEGGVDLFFDLDILFGIVSASISALPSIDLTLKEVIGNGGLPGDNAGTCFGFTLDAEMEICALFCASDRFNLFRAEDGNACIGGFGKHDTSKGLAGFDLARPRLSPSAVAVDGVGRQIVLAVESGDNLVATHMETGVNPVRRTIDFSALGVQHISVATLPGGRALAVWSESSLTAAQLDTLMRPAVGRNRVRESTPALARAQILRWSMFDGTAWSSPTRVASSQTGSVGKPQLASCRSSFDLTAGCSPRAPEVFLAWEHDAADNIEQPSLEVWGAEFTPAGGFGPAARLSAATGTHDMHPDVAYLGRMPVVTWVTSDVSLLTEPARRQIAVRVIDRSGSTPTYPINIVPGTTGAGWPTVATSGTSTLMLAFTRAQGTSMVGNRNALTAAKGSCNTGVCTFQTTQLRDPAGRQLRGEKPSLNVENGDAVIQFRALAYGPTAAGTVGLVTDAPGILLGTGDLLSVRVSNFAGATSTVAPQRLTADGLLNWRPEFVFDPSLDAFVGISQKASLPAQKYRAMEFAKRFAPKGFDAATAPKALNAEGLTMQTIASGPDFRIESVRMSQPWYEPGAAGSVTVVLRNAGGDYDPAVHGTAILATSWDAPPGAGIAGAANLALTSPLAANARQTLVRNFTVPAAHQRDALRTHFVEVKLPEDMPDANGADNLASEVIGAMPVPGEILARTKTNVGSVGLDWPDAVDPRVAGYRIYRRAENGEFVPYGSSQVSGYVDVFAGFRNAEEYRVTSYSENGIESEPSASVMAKPDKSTGLFTDSFEAAK